MQVALDGFDLVHRGAHFAERTSASRHRDVISQFDHYEPFKALRQFLGRQALEFFGGGHDDSVIQTHDNLLGWMNMFVTLPPGMLYCNEPP